MSWVGQAAQLIQHKLCFTRPLLFMDNVLWKWIRKKFLWRSNPKGSTFGKRMNGSGQPGMNYDVVWKRMMMQGAPECLSFVGPGSVATRGIRRNIECVIYTLFYWLYRVIQNSERILSCLFLANSEPIRVRFIAFERGRISILSDLIG